MPMLQHSIELPHAHVHRILRQACPNMKFSKDCALAFNRAGVVFILYITAAALEIAKKNKRTMITGADILDAVRDCDFEEIIPELKEFFEDVMVDVKKRNDLYNDKYKRNKRPKLDLDKTEGGEATEGSMPRQRGLGADGVGDGEGDYAEGVGEGGGGPPVGVGEDADVVMGDGDGEDAVAEGEDAGEEEDEEGDDDGEDEGDAGEEEEEGEEEGDVGDSPQDEEEDEDEEDGEE
uniref:Transcription factor CBF/NF-Y/archaeal histone domain-containing protein n=1 Tax=Chromera velia CCMP2878 TaxID=1169474 RepID=A0A0G4GW68_9ALVE|eukprot:Cvel_23660.t1-p1 / transcript=Cvel_23660.t1 / gene=Cvel_23660 / organism=Chromera_velia_CCMP2878 / gene_product=DNA polymerase epsilon subunit 3, putative / transcript_product=DNA polymerase epsilon subunit 3, putative / location=Cvel_scaffold2463:21878-25330(-) / protein_length=234 / sequence_SO=supercontig / SO=protein_coding / is_pseudo=false